MSDGINISVEGLEDLYLKLDVHLEKMNKASRAALRKGAMQIINDAKQNLRDGGNIVTGQLRASGKVQKVEGNADEIDAGFFSKNTSGGYAYYVEYGRRKGKMPPLDEIAQWIKKKGDNTRGGARHAVISMMNAMNEKRWRKKAYTLGELYMMAAWAVGKAIAKKGTKPHPFFNPAVEKNKDAVTKAIEQAVKKEIK